MESPKDIYSSDNQARLIQYLDDFGRQISTRKSNSSLEEQLSSLSKAYNQAQQKLLQTEKSLMSESFLMQKLRSVIDIYKCILSEDMQDDAIISFVQQIQEESQENGSICQQLSDIKNIINQRKSRSCKKQYEGDRMIKQMKKEMSKLYQQKKQISQDSSFMENLTEDLSKKLKECQSNLQDERQQKDKLLSEKISFQKMFEQSKQNLKSLEINQKEINEIISNKDQLIKQYEEANKQLVKVQTYTKKLNNFLLSKFDTVSKENINHSNNNTFKTQNLEEITQKINNLFKIKKIYKKQKQSIKNNDFFLKQVSILKLFLSEEALSLVKEYQQKQLQCLQVELRNLAILEKNRILKLQECEREIWKYKVKLLKEDDCFAITSKSSWKNVTMKNSNQFLSAKESPQVNQCSEGNPIYDLSEFNQ